MPLRVPFGRVSSTHLWLRLPLYDVFLSVAAQRVVIAPQVLNNVCSVLSCIIWIPVLTGNL